MQRKRPSRMRSGPLQCITGTLPPRGRCTDSFLSFLPGPLRRGGPLSGARPAPGPARGAPETAGAAHERYAARAVQPEGGALGSVARWGIVVAGSGAAVVPRAVGGSGLDGERLCPRAGAGDERLDRARRGRRVVLSAPKDANSSADASRPPSRGVVDAASARLGGVDLAPDRLGARSCEGRGVPHGVGATGRFAAAAAGCGLVDLGGATVGSVAGGAPSPGSGSVRFTSLAGRGPRRVGRSPPSTAP